MSENQERPFLAFAPKHFNDVEPPLADGQRDDDGYVSSSTLDNPPSEVDEKVIDAADDFRKPRQSDLWKGERLFEIEVAVTLKPKEGKAIKVPILVDTIRGTLVREAIELAFRDERTNRIVAAILDNPRDRVRAEELQPGEEPDNRQTIIPGMEK